jgi:hypothetical protein
MRNSFFEEVVALQTYCVRGLALAGVPLMRCAPASCLDWPWGDGDQWAWSRWAGVDNTGVDAPDLLAETSYGAG